MRRVLTRILSSLPRPSGQATANSPSVSSKTSYWQDTGQIYYLLNTLKLSYEGEHGQVSFEGLSPQALASLLSDIEADCSVHLRPKVTAQHTASLNISVCAVSWQSREGETRIKAIDSAAVLRSTTPCFSKSQAVFKHAGYVSDNTSAPHTLPNQASLYTYDNVTPTQFLEKLVEVNADIPSQQVNKLPTNPNNFRRVFTPGEEQEMALAIERFSAHAGQPVISEKPST